MDYRQGETGRVFVIRFDHGEDFLGGLADVVRGEEVRQAWFQAFGGLARAGVVTGPREPVVPPEPVWARVEDTRETVAVGSVFWDGDEPLIHCHGAMGHHGDTLTACIRRDTRVYLLLEVLLYEITGVDAARPWYRAGGFNRLEFS